MLYVILHKLTVPVPLFLSFGNAFASVVLIKSELSVFWQRPPRASGLALPWHRRCMTSFAFGSNDMLTWECGDAFRETTLWIVRQDEARSDSYDQAVVSQSGEIRPSPRIPSFVPACQPKIRSLLALPFPAFRSYELIQFAISISMLVKWMVGLGDVKLREGLITQLHMME